MGTSLKLINNMKHLFVSYEIALMAKEKGFDELCFGSFNPTLNIWDPPFTSNSMLVILNDNDKVVCAAPLYQQLIDWFREKHRIDISLDLNYKQTYVFKYSELSSKPVELFRNDDYYKAYEGAIKEAFKLIK